MLANMRVGGKLYLLLGFMAAVMLLIGTAGLYSGKHAVQGLNTVYNDRVVPLKDLKVISDMYAVNIVDTSHKARNGNIKWDEARKNVIEAKKTIDDKWKAYLATFLVEEEKKLVNEIKPLMKTADDATARLLQILTAEDRGAIERFTVSELYPAIDPVSAKFSELVDLQLKVAKEEYDASSRIYDVSKMIALAVLVVGLFISVCLALVLIRLITRPLAAGVDVANRLAEGDLTASVEVRGNDETAMLMESIRRMTDHLREIIGGLAGTASQLAAASSQLTSTAEQIATGAEEVAFQAGTVATAGEEMSATSGDIAQNCQMAAEGAQRAARSASNGAEVVERTVAVMGQIAQKVKHTAMTVEGLGSRSDQIGAIIGTIEDIADQTNLLALNAAIEAARAGEQGRGFAVVADEVRALAARTSQATREIGGMIKTIQAETREAVSAMEQGVQQVESGTMEASRSGEALKEILEQISDVAMQVHQIATAAEQQTATTSEISNNIIHINDVMKSTSHGAQDAAAAAAQLNGNAEELMRMVKQFKL